VFGIWAWVDARAAGGAQPLMLPALTRSAFEVVSSNLLTDKEDTAMIWRGPILSGVIRQFFEQVLWTDLDVLLIDLPPGTSDAPLTVLQSLSIDGVILVTMPQALATMIVRKAANLIHQLKKPILGVVENMSYFAAPDTGTRYEIFGPSYADQVAELAGAPILARMPIERILIEPDQQVEVVAVRHHFLRGDAQAEPHMPPAHEGLIAVVGENMQPQPRADFRQVVTGGPRSIAGGPPNANGHFEMLHIGHPPCTLEETISPALYSDKAGEERGDKIRHGH